MGTDWGLRIEDFGLGISDWGMIGDWRNLCSEGDTHIDTHN